MFCSKAGVTQGQPCSRAVLLSLAVTPGSSRSLLWLWCLCPHIRQLIAQENHLWRCSGSLSCWKRYCRACSRKEEQREKCKFKRDDADCRVRCSTETEIFMDTQKARQHNIKRKLTHKSSDLHLMDLKLWNQCCRRERCHYIHSGRSKTQLQCSGLLLFFHYTFSG